MYTLAFVDPVGLQLAVWLAIIPGNSRVQHTVALISGKLTPHSVCSPLKWDKLMWKSSMWMSVGGLFTLITRPVVSSSRYLNRARWQLGDSRLPCTPLHAVWTHFLTPLPHVCASLSRRLRWEALHDEELTLWAAQPQEETWPLHHPQSTHGGIRGEDDSALVIACLFISVSRSFSLDYKSEMRFDA